MDAPQPEQISVRRTVADRLSALRLELQAAREALLEGVVDLHRLGRHEGHGTSCYEKDEGGRKSAAFAWRHAARPSTSQLLRPAVEKECFSS